MSTLELSAAITKFMSSFANASQITALQQKIDGLERKIKELEKSHTPFEKEFYSLLDLEKVLCLKPDSIRKKFILTGMIKAEKPKGSKAYVIRKEEFFRVVEVVKTKGNWALSA